MRFGHPFRLSCFEGTFRGGFQGANRESTILEVFLGKPRTHTHTHPSDASVHLKREPFRRATGTHLHPDVLVLSVQPEAPVDTSPQSLRSRTLKIPSGCEAFKTGTGYLPTLVTWNPLTFGGGGLDGPCSFQRDRVPNFRSLTKTGNYASTSSKLDVVQVKRQKVTFEPPKKTRKQKKHTQRHFSSLGFSKSGFLHSSLPPKKQTDSCKKVSHQTNENWVVSLLRLVARKDGRNYPILPINPNGTTQNQNDTFQPRVPPTTLFRLLS